MSIRKKQGKMIKRSKNLKMLAGVSVIALTVISHPPKTVFAANLSPGNFVTINVDWEDPTNPQYQVIGGGDASLTDGITYGVGIVKDAKIDGFLINEGEIYATLEDDAGAGDVFGVYIEEGVTFNAGGVQNRFSGEIYASAIDGLAGLGSDDFSYAEAVGVEFHAAVTTALNDDAAANVQNKGGSVIDAFASAEAYGTADAFAAGVREFVFSYDESSAYLDNHGRISADASAFVVYDTVAAPFGSAYATATGVMQFVFAGGGGEAYVSNDGVIEAMAFGYAEADMAYSEASAGGIVQLVDAGDPGSAIVVNADELSEISATATAIAYGSAFASASAEASGVFQYVEGSQPAQALTENSGLIHADALAYSSAEDALATADAVGVGQIVHGFDGADATVYNFEDSIIHADADAMAYGSSLATARAVAAGVYQSGEADAPNALVYFAVYNSGDILGYATASASSSGDAYAEATAAGIYQSGRGLADVSLDVVNEGLIDATSKATATSGNKSGGLAVAEARSVGVAQFATSSDDPKFAWAYLQNDEDGLLLVSASADSYADSGFAYSTASAAGVYQGVNLDPSYLGDGFADVINLGIIGVDVEAYASGAFASARSLAAGVAQDTYAVSDDDGFGIADASIYNIGLIRVDAWASADGYTSALAYSTAVGIAQQAFSTIGAADSDTLDAYAELLNSGHIVVMSEGKADSADGGALSLVRAIAGSQFADAYDDADVSGENTGTIVSFAESDADGRQYARAVAASGGIQQEAEAIGTATASFVNDHSLVSIADANAYATGFGQAFASGYASGLVQLIGASGTADAYAENNGMIWVTSLVDAESYDANAWGGSIGIDQIVMSDQMASTMAVNNGQPDLIDLYAELGGLAAGNLEAGLIGSYTPTPENFAGTGDTPILGGIYAISAVMAEGMNASALAEAGGISQAVYGLDASAYATNNGYIGVISAAISGMEDSSLIARAYSEALGIAQVAGSLADSNNVLVQGAPPPTVATADLTNIGSNNVLGLALAGGFYAEAEVEAGGFLQSVNGSDAYADATNDGSMMIISAGLAMSDPGDDSYAEGIALAFGGLQYVSGSSIGEASAVNNGTLSANAIALAIGGDDAYAESQAGGLVQIVSGMTADASATNTGTPDLNLFDGGFLMEPPSLEDELPGADLIQLIDGLYVVSVAVATGYDSVTAVAYGTGIGQGVEASTGEAEVYNEGYIGVATFGVAMSEEGSADAYVEGYGIAQQVRLIPEANIPGGISGRSSFENGYDEQLNVGGLAFVDGYDSADAFVHVDAVQQSISGFRSASAETYNEGDIRAYGLTFADAEELGATANVASHAISQQIDGYEDGIIFALADNEGLITGFALADAEGYEDALAQASAAGVAQILFGDVASAEVRNEGSVLALSDALANATGIYGSAIATASATGVYQFVDGYEDGATAILYNNSTIDAVATAGADGYLERADAFSLGHFAGGRELLNVVFENTEDGVLMSIALADAYDSALAVAVGANFEADLYLDGTIINDGRVAAWASTYDGGTAIAQGVVQKSNEGNDTVLTNTGEIIAFAQGQTAFATAIAIGGGGLGKDLSYNGEGEDVATVTNSGGAIIAAFYEEADVIPVAADPETKLYHRGTAITTAGSGPRLVQTGSAPSHSAIPGAFGPAPNAVDIYLEGDDGTVGYDYAFTKDYASQVVQDWFEDETTAGYIFGDIDITDDDSITVRDGVTIFDGIVNPAEYESETYGEGSLTIKDGGTLAMLRNDYDGPSGASVEKFNVESGGTFAIELTDEYGEGDYSQVFTKNANIGGDVAAIYRPGMYRNEYLYNNVVDVYDTNIFYAPQNSTVVGGTGFASVYDNSALLDTRSVVDEGGDIDLHITRVEFNKVPGSTRNQSAAGSGIEKVYDNGDGIDEETPFGKLVSYLFTLDEKEYGDAMDQMGGAEYAQHLQSVLWSTRSMQRTITERMECSDGGSRDAQSSLGGKGTGTGVVPTGGKPMDSTGCFEPGRASLWVRGFGQINSMSGDNNNPGMDENQNGVTFGGDYSFDENWFLGLAGGYFNSTGEFDAWGGRNGASIDYDGWQLAAYGGFDNSDYYLRGIVAYGGYDGTSHRSFALNQNWDDTDHDAYHGTHTPITGNLSGDLSSNVLSFYGETGYRVDISNSATFTPYVGLNVASASLDGFTESDPSNTGAALRINDSDAMSIASVLGLRFNGEMIMGSGLFTPSVSVAWAHEFADTAQVDMSYAGEGASPGANFVISGTDVALDAILIDAGANFSVSGTFDIGLYYNGSYNADYMSNAVSARLHYKF